ncbi:hypothetical protein CW748_12325 [Alteromonadales bacterium alter-6D02]|nr:hypothetical protein CW748_12325 [Alteromonadales bacterium alter-6D02]
MNNKESTIKHLTIIFILLLSGCSANLHETIDVKPTTNQEPKATSLATTSQVITLKKAYTPQLWSDHKVVNESPDLCAIKGVSILKSLGFKLVTKNHTYVYGNFSNNRAVIKCTPVNQQTFVYTAVAGEDVKLIERLRNEIMWKL